MDAAEGYDAGAMDGLRRTAGLMEGALQWWIGDWWNAREPYGERVEQVKERLNLKIETVRQYAYVAKNVSIRIETLTFGHHQVVAAFEPEEQKEWLDRAAEGQWTIRDMRSALRKGDDGGAAVIELREPYQDPDYDKDEPTDWRQALRVHVGTAVELAGLVEGNLKEHPEALTNAIRKDIEKAHKLWAELELLACGELLSRKPRTGSAEVPIEERREEMAKVGNGKSKNGTPVKMGKLGVVVDEACSEIQSLGEEMREAFDNTPENLQQTETCNAAKLPPKKSNSLKCRKSPTAWRTFRFRYYNRGTASAALAVRTDAATLANS